MTERRPLRGRREGDAAVAETLLDGLGPRLAALRREHGVSLGELAGHTGISRSTLSRLETGGRRATLELLVPVALAYGLTLDELLGLPCHTRFRVPPKPGFHTSDMVTWPLTRSTVSPLPFKIVYSATASVPPADLATHDGWTWMYVIAGRLRVIVDGADVVLGPGEAAEIDTRRAHWTGSTGEGPVEVLALFGPRGEMPVARILPAGPPPDTAAAPGTAG
jgi:mannose-6-phosphate isomerase-like protein (cupin superfamily)/DNA-binding XRE family transcriptional regulator